MRLLCAAALAVQVGHCASLFNQELAAEIDHKFARGRVEYMVMDATTSAIIARKWEGSMVIPAGSLVKPFLARAEGQSRVVFRCDPAECWYARGHGTVDIPHAIAFSCNSAFLQLARQVSPDQLGSALDQYGLAHPPIDSRPETWIGLGNEWRLDAAALVRAYCQIAREPGSAAIRKGLHLSAQLGTGRAIGLDALIKTGTASCSHRHKDIGDGLAVALYPAAAPTYAVLVRMHNKPGSQAAGAAGAILRVAAGQ